MIKSINARIALAVVLLILSILIDYIVVSDISLWVIYLFPIVIFSYQNSLQFKYAILFSLIAAIAWFVVDHLTHKDIPELYRLINWFTKIVFAILTAVAGNRYFRNRRMKEIIQFQKIALENSNYQLNEVNKELNKLIGMAAHDIRNPVGSIKMIAEMYLEKEELSQESMKWIQLIDAAATNSLQILNDTLNISKIQSGTISLNIIKGDYIKFIHDCVISNQYLALKKNQEIVFESTIEQVDVDFDSSRLSQVVNNLLTNAIKYSNSNTSIIVNIKIDEEDKNTIVTSVIDQGLGIDEKYHATLFDPFTTTANKPTNNESSTGLGLAIVKKIVELHNGTINFTSEKGKGSNFYFSIPIIS